jgi:hypothetical protein
MRKQLSRWLCLCLFALALFSMTAHADAATLYGATAAGGPGELYILDPATGAVVQDVGPLNDVTGLNYGMTGLAFHPLTGVLYGSTSNSEGAATQARLVTINPATALVTVIGSYNAGPVNTSGTPATMADLAFNAAGNLFGVGSVGGPQLYSINTGTAQATVIGDTGLTSTSGGGLEVGTGGVFYGTPTAARFGTYDSVLGTYTNIANPTKPVGGAYAALSFDGSLLYGLDLGPSPALTTHLVTIDATGAVSDIGASVNALDAIAFQVPEPSTAVLWTFGLAALIGWRRR